MTICVHLLNCQLSLSSSLIPLPRLSSCSPRTYHSSTHTQSKTGYICKIIYFQIFSTDGIKSFGPSRKRVQKNSGTVSNSDHQVRTWICKKKTNSNKNTKITHSASHESQAYLIFISSKTRRQTELSAGYQVSTCSHGRHYLISLKGSSLTNPPPELARLIIFF